MRMMTIACLAVLALPAIAEDAQPYSVHFRFVPAVAPSQVAFEGRVVENSTGKTVLDPTLTFQREETWGELTDTIDGRTFKLKVRGRSDGSGEVHLIVREGARVVQRVVTYVDDPRPFSGQPITMNVVDADLKEILRTLAKMTKTNIAVDQGVTGKVTLDAQDMPWDQALDRIASQNGLIVSAEANVIRLSHADKR